MLTETLHLPCLMQLRYRLLALSMELWAEWGVSYLVQRFWAGGFPPPLSSLFKELSERISTDRRGYLVESHELHYGPDWTKPLPKLTSIPKLTLSHHGLVHRQGRLIFVVLFLFFFFNIATAWGKPSVHEHVLPSLCSTPFCCVALDLQFNGQLQSPMPLSHHNPGKQLLKIWNVNYPDTKSLLRDTRNRVSK